MIGVIDSSLGRISVFRPEGTLVADARIPETEIPFFSGSSSFSSTLVGISMNPGRPPLELPMRYRHVEIDVESGQVMWERNYPGRPNVGAGCPEDEGLLPGLGLGAFSSTGSVAFNPCRGQLLFFAARDDAAATVVSAPRYVPEFPSEQEVEEYLESAGPFAMEQIFRRTPKPYMVSWVFDDRGRLWVVTNRERDEDASFLDLYSGPEYWGAVRVRHDALAVDVLGSTLVVLVDRPVGPGDADGYPDRGVDWYDISELEAPAYDPGS